uniref:non-specific serine/threonine protein kinase n=2 Tax=Nothobranchius kuhntae TaxID=321403 RepID=A0A1A8HUF7_NOTKU
MRRGEKPEGYRQMRPKILPVGNCSGNSQQMLMEIRKSLRDMSKPSDSSKVDNGGHGKMAPEDPRRSSNPKHHKALQEIRKSLVPYEVNGSSSTSDINKPMCLEPPCAGFEERRGATNYQDQMREPVMAANTSSSGLKAPGSSHMQQVVLRRPSWKGSKEALAPRLGPHMADGMVYRPDSPGPPPVYPPLRGVAASNSPWDNNPSTKRWSGNVEYFVPRISPVPQGAWPDGYPNPPPQNQRGANPGPVVHQPIIMQSSGNKFTSPSTRTQNGSAQQDYIPGSSRQPPPPYPVNQSSRHSPTEQPASSPSYVNGGNIPPPMLVSNWSSSNQDLSPSWQQNVPVRSNSFNNHQLNGRPAHQASSQPSATTVTAITQAPILQPVSSTQVQKPELHTAVAPTHPPWKQHLSASPAAPAYPEPSPQVPQIPAALEAPNYIGPPPPYPKHLLQQPAAPSPPAYDAAANKLVAGREESPEEERSSSSGSSGDASREKVSESLESTTAAEKERKQITTSPVPVRRNNKKDEERRGESGRVNLYSPQAFKFFMEQHMENILKNHQQRIRRRKQLECEMDRVGLSYEAQKQMRMMLYQKESNYIRQMRAKMDKSMFKRIKTLGIGAFGEVCLARKEDTGSLYAMKTLRKKDVLLRNQVAHVKAERDILAEADNEWVVRLYYSFQDKENLYFVMEYIPGGDMMSLLIRLGIFKEELAQFYIAELTCAVESVHKMGFIHRDIKPDNILIDRDGHIKLTDFGLCTGFRWTHDSKYYQSGDHERQDSMDFSKEWEDQANCRCSERLKPLERRKARQHQRCLAHSLVGTPNYIAPEVLLRTGYTQLCDWWSVGVILYEMVVGQPPFLASTPLETQLKVINWKSTLHIPPQAKLTPEASDLIVKLCRDPEDRLGKNGADEIKAHPFFKRIDFSSDLRQQVAPYVPTIAHSTDTSNFDPVDPEKLRSSNGEGNHNDTLSCWFRKGKHPEHAFYEFTFRRFFDDNGHPYSCPKPIEYEGYDEDEADMESAEHEAGKQGRDLVYV